MGKLQDLHWPYPGGFSDVVMWLGVLFVTWITAHALWIGASYVVHFTDARRHRADTPGEAMVRLRDYARAWLWEIWYSLIVSATYPLGMWPARQHHIYEPRGGPPIVLVHGYLMNRACMMALAWRLRRQGYRNVYSIDLRPAFGSIEKLGERATSQLREVIALCQGRPLYAVCHSMGGVVLRWCASNHADLALAKIICIASPHQGTAMALMGLGANAVQMRRNSAFLAGLTPHQVPVVSIFSNLDNIIIPARSAAFGTEVAVTNLGHAAVLYDRAVFNAVVAALRETPSPGTTVRPPVATVSANAATLAAARHGGR